MSRCCSWPCSVSSTCTDLQSERSLSQNVCGELSHTDAHTLCTHLAALLADHRSYGSIHTVARTRTHARTHTHLAALPADHDPAERGTQSPRVTPQHDPPLVRHFSVKYLTCVIKTCLSARQCFLHELCSYFSLSQLAPMPRSPHFTACNTQGGFSRPRSCTWCYGRVRDLCVCPCVRARVCVRVCVCARESGRSRNKSTKEQQNSGSPRKSSNAGLPGKHVRSSPVPKYELEIKGFALTTNQIQIINRNVLNFSDPGGGQRHGCACRLFLELAFVFVRMVNRGIGPNGETLNPPLTRPVNWLRSFAFHRSSPTHRGEAQRTRLDPKAKTPIRIDSQQRTQFSTTQLVFFHHKSG